MFIEKLVESIIGNPYASGDKEQESVIKEINTHPIKGHSECTKPTKNIYTS